MKRIFISAGDASGDLHAAKLMIALKSIYNDIDFIGIGGSAMEKAGLSSLIKLSEISVVGFWEVAKKYSMFRDLLLRCKQIINNTHIDAFIPVDYPGFNLRLAGFAKQAKVPVIYYIAPQLWAWGENRAEKLAKAVDKLLVVFPFEEDFFKKHGIDTKFVGHPLLDIPEYLKPPKPFEQRDKRILLLAGSRKQEILKHLPLLVKISENIHKQIPDYQLVFAKSNNTDINLFTNTIAHHDYITICENTKELMLSSRAGVVKTGTSNLEAALSGMPFSMYYITSFISYQMGKKLINLDYISLVNILSNSPIISEFIQGDAIPEKIANNTVEIIRNRKLFDDIQSSFDSIKSNLGGSGASLNAAMEIQNYL